MRKSAIQNALTITPEGAHPLKLISLTKYDPIESGNAQAKPAIILTAQVISTGKIEKIFLNVEHKDGQPSVYDRTVYDIDAQCNLADDYDTDDLEQIASLIKNKECIGYAVHNESQTETGLKTYCNWYFNTNAPKVQAMLIMR